MAKNNRVNTDDLFSKMIGKEENKNQNEEKVFTENEKRGRHANEEKLVQKAYYITEQQFKAIKLLAVEKDTNTSSIIRSAIDMYLDSENK